MKKVRKNKFPDFHTVLPSKKSSVRIHHPTNTVENLVHRADAVDLEIFVLPGVVGTDHFGLLAIDLDAVADDILRRIVGTTRILAAQQDAAHQLLFGDMHVDHERHAQPVPADGASIDDTLYAAMNGANLFLGLSGPGTLKPDMLKGMAEHPVIFACANPVPEIGYEEAKAVRPDAIMGTGRSDYPNQVNNVSGFPFIFRGALDVRASKINEEMKIAAARALADLALEPVPEDVRAAYHGRDFTFGPDYVIPMPLDPRIIEWVAPAVASAAVESGVARGSMEDIGGSVEAYRVMLRERMSKARARMASYWESYNK